jgi:hypothetical protein
VAKLLGVIVVLFDSNSIDVRERISFNVFWSEEGVISISDGAAGGGATGRDGDCGAMATNKDGVFVAGALLDGAAIRDGIFGDGTLGEEVFMDLPAEDEPARIRSSNSSPACVRGAIFCSMVALIRLSPTRPLTTIVRPSMMMEPRSAIYPKTGRTWERLSAQATGLTLGSTANSSTTLPGVAP